MAPFMQGMVADTFAVGLLAFAITTILIMNNDAESWFFKLVKNVCCLSIAAGVCILFYNSCQSIVSMSHYIIGSIIVGVVSMIIFIACSPSDGVKVGNFKRTMVRISGCIFFFAIAILVYALLYKLIGISHPISAIITTVAYALIAIAAAYCGD
jgi:hypothetical protein